MKRNIITTIELTKDKVAMNVLEQLASNTIEIFHAQDQLTHVNSFISQSLAKINNIIKGKIKDVFVVLEPSETVAAHIQLVSHKIQVANHHISEKDISYLIASTKEKYEQEGKAIIALHPLQFAVEGMARKIYSQAPIHIKGDYVSATMAMTSISLKTYAFINKLGQSHNLHISHIFTTTQAISNNCLSSNAMHKGAVLVNFGTQQTFVTINKNGGTIAHFNIYNFGFNQLIENVKASFDCTYKEAHNLILIYGSLKAPGGEEIIYVHQEGIREIKYTKQELQSIIENYFLRAMTVIKKYIAQKNIHNIPFVIAGKVTHLAHVYEFAQHVLLGHVALYSPIEYLETNAHSENILGVLKMCKTLNKVPGNDLTMLVKTNPHLFAYLIPHAPQHKNIIYKLIGKLGAKYDWNI